MNIKQHHTSKALPFLMLALLALLFIPSFVSSNPSAATDSRSHVPSSRHKPKLWGVVPKLIDSSIPKYIIVMGGPASGKGTQCQNLADKYGLVHISSGDLLRQAVSSSKGGPAAPHISMIKNCMEAGKLIPDSLMTRLILDRLDCRDCQERGYILDGFPRTLSQAKSLEEAGISPDVFLILNVRDKEAINRVVGRRTDSVTGKVYHLEWNPPPNEEVRQRLVIRSDDTLESMKHRLNQFRANVASVEDWYRDIKREIDGSGTPSEVSRDIEATLKQLRQRKQLV